MESAGQKLTVRIIPMLPEGVEQEKQILIFSRLRAAATGTGLEVRTHDGLAGAWVTGPEAEAYVIAAAKGFQVEMWQPDAFDPFWIESAQELDQAVKIALAAAGPCTTSARRSE